MKQEWTTNKDFVDDVIESVEGISKSEPYLAINILCQMIELFGKLISGHKIENSGTSRADFTLAIDQLEAFAEYRELPFDFYSQVRCSLVHGLLPEKQITFSEGENNLRKKTIGCKDLLKTIKSAWKEVQDNENAKKWLSKKGAIIRDGYTGGTKSIVVKM